MCFLAAVEISGGAKSEARCDLAFLRWEVAWYHNDNAYSLFLIVRYAAARRAAVAAKATAEASEATSSTESTYWPAVGA